MPWRLVRRYLFAHWVRSALTLASIVVATFLICVLRALIDSINAGVELAAANRLVAQSAVSLFVDLPHAYQTKIETVDGVDLTCKLTWFGGYYQTRRNFFAQFGVQPERLLDLYPELEVVDGSAQDFVAQRNACLIGQALVDSYGWQVGDVVPIIGTYYTRNDGRPWEFQVRGVYTAPVGFDQSTLYFHHDYLDEALETGSADGPEGVSVYGVRIEPGIDPTRVMADIDLLFENGPLVVQTTTEREFNRQFVTMMGNVPTLLGSIGGGVLFAILLAAVNTMVMAGRERTRDLGVLKALGFGDGKAFALLLAESLCLCFLGGLFGVGLAVVSEPGMRQSMSRMFPGYAVSTDMRLVALGIAAALGLVAGAVPAWQAKRLEPVEALRAEV